MAELSACPSSSDLKRLVLGQLAETDAARIQKHLDHCEPCLTSLQQCVASDEFLNAVRTNRPTNSETTQTLNVSIDWLRGALATWMRTHDRTESDKVVLPPSMADVKGLFSPPEAPDEIGRMANFRVLRVLGVGGMAVVFEAEDMGLKRRVALKLMRPAIAASPGATERFLREAQSAAALKHEHVMTVYQVGTFGATPFMALELLSGETLDARLNRTGRMSVREVARIGREIALGLAAAHARGLLHRDIKPANIWLESSHPPADATAETATQHDNPASVAHREVSSGKVKILDFGLAKTWRDESGLSYPGLLIGTPAYMAPEQLAGEAVDPRTDLFSLGCLMYRMAAGKHPFGGENLLSVVQALTVKQPVPVRTLNPECPQALADLIGQLLAKSPGQRPPSAQAVADVLQSILRSLPAERPSKQMPTERTSPAPRGRRIGPLIAASVALIFLAWLVASPFAAQIIRIATNKGQIVIQVDDPTVTVTVKEDTVLIHDGQGQAEITVAAGEHQLQVTLTQSSGQSKFITDKFTLHRGERKVVEVREELAKISGPKINTSVATAALKPVEIGTAITELKPQRPPNPGVDRSVAAWVLSRGGNVALRTPGAPATIDVEPGQALPKPDFQLTKIRLQNGSVTDADLRQLRGLTNLAALRLSGRQMTGAGAENLCGLSELKILDVANTNLADAALVRLQGLTKLEYLSLDATRITDAGLVRLAAFKHLRTLILNWTRVTDAGLASLQALPQLDVLYLRGSGMTEAGLKHVTRLKRLRVLNLSYLPLTDGGLGQLAPLTNLQHLVLDHTPVTDAGVAQLKQLPQLEILFLGHTRVTGNGLTELQGLKSLHVVCLKGSSNVGDSAVASLSSFRNLTDLDVSDTRITAKGFKTLKAGLPARVRVIWTEPNAAAAKAVITAGGTLEIHSQKSGAERSVKELAEIPSDQFKISAVSLAVSRGPHDDVFAALVNPDVDLLTSLDLTGAALSDANWQRVKTLPHLRRLTLADTAVRSPGPEEFESRAQLEGLDLTGTETDDAGLERLRSLPRLTTLVLDRTRITDAGLTHLAELASLKVLTLRYTAITDEGLKRLQGMKNLQFLKLSGTRVSDAGLAHLRSLAALKSLDLTHTSMTDAGAERIAALAGLENLTLKDARVGDGFLKHIGNLKNLRSLNLDWTGVTDVGVQQLAALPRLEVIAVRGTGVTEAGLAALKGLSQLRILSLSRLPITDTGLATIGELKNLQNLSLDQTRVGNAGLAHLGGLSQLATLDLSRTAVTEDGLASLQRLKNLRILSLQGLPGLTDTAVPKILRLKALRIVDLRDTQISAAAFEVLKSARPGLQCTWSEPNHETASAVLASGGHLDVRLAGTSTDRPVNSTAEIPSTPFHITRVRLAGSRETLNKLLPAIANPRLDGLVALDLSGTPIDDADISRLKALVTLRELNLADTRVTDAGLEHLKDFVALKRLVLDGDAIRGSGLMHLQELPELEELRLGCPNLTELFLSELSGFKKLERLSLAKSNSSDEGAKYLAPLTHLKELDISQTHISAARVAELTKSLPHCRVMATAK